MLQNRKKENSFEWSLADEQGRRPAAGYIPFKEISLRESLSLNLEDVRIPVAADVGVKEGRQTRQAAADVEDLPARRHVRKRRRDAGLAHAPGQEAVEGAVFPHGTVLAPPS